MRRPSGDQTGLKLPEASNVKRVSTPRASSWSQMSLLMLKLVFRGAASVFSSGESANSTVRAGAPTFPRGLPPRSYQTSWYNPKSAPAQ